MTHIIHIDLGREMRGGQRQVLYLARGLAARGNLETSVVCLRGSPLEAALQSEGIAAVGVSGRNELNPFVFFRALRAARGAWLPILHTHEAKAASLGALLRRSVLTRAKLVHTRRTVLPVGRMWSAKKYRDADAVACVSRGVARMMEEAGVARERLLVIPSAIDPALYSPRRERGDGRLVFGMIGALTPEKGHLLFLEALGLLQSLKALPPWEARFVGAGPLLETLLNRGEELGIRRHLSFLGAQEGRAILPQCDMLVVPSTEREASSGVIREGWATGLPVVCSDLPGNTEMVRDGVNGLVFDRHSAESLAGQVLRLLREPALGEELAANGRASLPPYLVSTMVESYSLLYRRLAGAMPGSPAD